jgi:hypothetical protein
MPEKVHLLPIIGIGGTILFLAGLSTLAVSSTRRREIIDRDGGCQDTSGESHFGILEVAHINHTHDNQYAENSNLVTLCSKHHLCSHLENEGNNGLSTEANHAAIRLICTRIAGLWTNWTKTS